MSNFTAQNMFLLALFLFIKCKHPRRPGSTLVIGLDRSQLRSIARLAPVAARQSSSRARQQDRARLAPSSRTELVSRPTAGPSLSCTRCSRTGDGGLFSASPLGLSVGGRSGVCKGATFPLVSLVGVATGLGCGGVKVLDAGAVALVVVARCSWAEPVAWCCPVAMAVWAAW